MANWIATRAAAGIALGLVAGVIALSAPALALAPLEIDYTTDRDANFVCTPWAPEAPGDFGRGCFVADGDKFWVVDNLDDSKRVALHWHLTSGERRGLCINKHGNGSWDQWCNKNLPEDDRIEFRMGRCDGSTSTCDHVGDFTDWGAWSPTYSVGGGAGGGGGGGSFRKR